MSSLGWLTLNDYSHKYRVSLSTLRRKIKSNAIEHRLEDGKYWLKDSAVPSNPAAQEAHKETQDKALLSMNQLMQEIKAAYVAVLHEKEIQITELKEEIADLKTLVKVLESENERLQTHISESAPIDSWLEKNFET